MIRTFVQALREPLPRLTPLQRWALAAFGVAVAATRFAALSLTIHDWDETLFAFGIREYDVELHHPHPPGYPVFIALAKVARLFTDSEFHALQAVATVASMLVFPAAFLLARELRFRLLTAFIAAGLAAFLPTVWYYGGTGLSDVPALALLLFACAMLLRGGRSGGAYLAGALLTAAACAIRPQLLAVAFLPALAGALASRRVRAVAGAWAASGAAVVFAYLGAAYFSSHFPNGYIEQALYIRRHIRSVDSFRNPHRVPLKELAPRALLSPAGGGRIWTVVLVLGGIAVVDALARRRAAVLLVLLMFFPMAVFTWLMLDVSALPRYALAYVAMYALLAAAGLDAVAALVPARAALPVVLLAAGYVGWGLIKWTRAPLRFARTEPSPPAAAFRWIRENVPRGGPKIFVDNEILALTSYLLEDYDYQPVFEERDITPSDLAFGNIRVVEGEVNVPGARVFRWKRLQLWEISRPRYFEVTILPLNRCVIHGEGWHDPESAGDAQFRWMGPRSVTWFGPTTTGQGELRLHVHAPIDGMAKPPVMTVIWNGRGIDWHLVTAEDFDLRYPLPSRTDGPNQLVLMTDQTVRPKGDPRELGLSISSLTWTESTHE